MPEDHGRPSLYSVVPYVKENGDRYQAEILWVSMKPYTRDGKIYWACTFLVRDEIAPGVQSLYHDREYDPRLQVGTDSGGPPY